MSFCKKIFSISKEKETHYVMQFLGFRIKFAKSKFARRRKSNPYYYYKKNNVDITTIPPAEGQTRGIQLANLALLKEFDRICSENGLQYWLFAGTALGAVRHKGFIPWDDDIDTAMPRTDFDRIVETFNQNTRDKNLYAAPYCNTGKNSFIIKIKHKLCEHIFVDIYAVDYSNEILTKYDQIKITSEIKCDRAEIYKHQPKDMPPEECCKLYLALRSKYIKNDTLIEKSDILLGIEWDHFEKNWFIKYESVFPLKKTMFEGHEFNSMNVPEDYLSDYYGNYMEYPKKIGFGHCMYLDLTEDEKKVIEDLKRKLS